MKTTIEAKKQKAIELMQELDIYKPYIRGFKDENKVCFYEGFAGFWADQEPELDKKLRELEKKYNFVCYAITHEYLEFGECYSFLVVPDDDEDWHFLVDRATRNNFYAFAYVWNKDYEYDSEFGSIAVQSFGGGIRRIG